MPEDKKRFELGDYVEVKDRIKLFYELYAGGRLVTDHVEMLTAPDGTQRVMVTARAYRAVDDPLPGVGTSWLQIPGSTPYTRGSEVENAETSAWGRAIGALGILIDRSIATSNEIENKQGPSLGAQAAPAEEPATMRPAGKESEAFLGILSKSGVIRKGGAEGYKLERRETPEGPTFGFRLELGETEESGGHKAIPQVLVPPALALPLLLDIGGDPAALENQSARLKGQLYQVSQPGRTSYYRLLVREWKDDERVLPAPEPPAEALPDEGLFSESEQAAIDAAVEAVG